MPSSGSCSFMRSRGCFGSKTHLKYQTINRRKRGKLTVSPQGATGRVMGSSAQAVSTGGDGEQAGHQQAVAVTGMQAWDGTSGINSRRRCDGKQGSRQSGSDGVQARDGMGSVKSIGGDAATASRAAGRAAAATCRHERAATGSDGNGQRRAGDGWRRAVGNGRGGQQRRERKEREAWA
ncbi:unnamed protein product [Victoria cruziana]